MLKVDTIEKGTVIDHIKGGKGKKVLTVLGIGEDYPHRVALMMNVPSKKSGTKDIVKIEGKVVDEDAGNTIALISPGATINIIENEKVVKKYTVELPERLEGLGRCPNPNCITNSQRAKKEFSMDAGLYRCHYCERLFDAEELV